MLAAVLPVLALSSDLCVCSNCNFGQPCATPGGCCLVNAGWSCAGGTLAACGTPAVDQKCPNTIQYTYCPGPTPTPAPPSPPPSPAPPTPPPAPTPAVRSIDFGIYTESLLFANLREQMTFLHNHAGPGGQVKRVYFASALPQLFPMVPTTMDQLVQWAFNNVFVDGFDVPTLKQLVLNVTQSNAHTEFYLSIGGSRAACWQHMFGNKTCSPGPAPAPVPGPTQGGHCEDNYRCNKPLHAVWSQLYNVDGLCSITGAQQYHVLLLGWSAGVRQRQHKQLQAKTKTHAGYQVPRHAAQQN